MKTKNLVATLARLNAGLERAIARAPVLRDVQAISKEFWREVFELAGFLCGELGRLHRGLRILWRGHQKRR